MTSHQVLVGLLLLAGIGTCATRSLPRGDPDRGREVFRAENCGGCHSLNGQGGRVAPDLAREVERGFSPAQLVSRMWNHAPRMWSAMERQGWTKPRLSKQQAADLFAYFYSARPSERPGQWQSGRQLFVTKRCGDCHGLTATARPGVRPLSEWEAMADPIALAQRMWNHSAEIKRAFDQRGISYPRLTSQELTDLAGYIRGLPRTGGDRVVGALPPAESGETLLTAKGCTACHAGARSLEARHTRYSPMGFAAAMWNHAFQAPGAPVQMSYEEMRRLVGYLSSAQFSEERGDRERGRAVFDKKRCATCHEAASTGAPNLATVAGRMTSYDMVAALWEHGPAMWREMQARKIPWPRFRASEMADLTAYLHGVEFKQRPGQSLLGVRRPEK